MRRSSRLSLLLLALGLPGAVLGQVFPDQPAELLPGFKANQVYSPSGIDNVNAYSGDAGIVVPIGPVYSLAAGTSFQLTAAYSNKFWAWDTNTCGDSGEPAFDPYHATFAMGGPLGLGWAWPLGYVEASVNMATYYSPDGGRHEFKSTPWESRWITVDGSNLRLVNPPVVPLPSSYTIEFPDGTTRVYSTSYVPPQAGSSPDFYWQKANTIPPTRYLLRQIIHANGSAVLLEVDNAHGGHPQTITLNPNTPEARTISLNWGLFPATPPPSGLQWTVLQSATFPNPSGSLLTVTAGYETMSIARLRTGGGDCPVLSGWAEVPVLASLESTAPGIAASTTSFEYYSAPTTISDGSMWKITLPTGGTIEYEYGPARQHLGGGASPSSQDPDLDRLEMMTDESPAVIVRTELDPTNPAYQSVTKWQRIHDGGIIIGRYRRVVMVAPGAEREYFFTVAEGSAPPSGLELMSRVYRPGSFATPSDAIWQPSVHADRTIVSCYQGDLENGSGQTAEACNVIDSLGNVTGAATELNVRKSRSVTWYADLQYASLPGEPSNWMSGRITCGDTEPCSLAQSTEYHAPARQYKTTTVSANHRGLLPVKRETRTNYTRVTNGPWLLGVYDERRTTDIKRDDDATNWCVEPCTSKVKYTFTTSGFLDDVEVEDRNAGDTLLGSVKRDFTLDGLGNPILETDTATSLTGSPVPRFDTSRSFVTERTFKNGALLMAERRKTAGTEKYHPSFKVDRDADGYVTFSYDANNLSTAYTYDALGRVRSVAPPSSDPSAHKTTYYYVPAVTEGTNKRGPYVIVREGQPALEASSVDPAQGGVGRFEVYLYDGFGRLVREIQRVPNGGPTALAFRKTTYDSAGRRTFLSEWAWCGTGTDAQACFAASTAVGTTWAYEYSGAVDPFGRPVRITKTDGTAVTISYADSYCMDGSNPCGAALRTIDYSDTKVTSTTPNVAGGSSISAQRKDLLGRAVEAFYPYPTTPGDGMLYRYNVLDKVAYASTITDEAGPRLQPARTFTYDRIGNLRSETHPEKGTTSYLQYDPLANGPWRQEASGTYFHSVFDRLGRLETLSAGPSVGSQTTYVTQTYDTGTITSAHPKGRLATRIGQNYGSQTGSVTEEFGYSGQAGQLTAKKVTLNNPSSVYDEAWTYHDLGYVTSYNHPWQAGSTFQRPKEEYAIKGGKVVSSMANFGARSTDLLLSATYNPAGGLATYTTANDAITTIAADTSYRPSRISTLRLGETLFDTGNYTYDGLGNVTSMVVPGAPAVTDSFGYDPRSRLTGASFNNGAQTETYEYDDYGNLKKRTQNGGTPWQPAIDLLTNRLATSSGYLYDLEGNLTSDGAGRTYAYDLLSRQVGFTDTSSGRNDSYLFSGDGERTVSIAVNGNKFVTLRDAGKRVATEVDVVAGSPTARRDIMFLGNLQIAVFEQTGINMWTYYASDHLGTPRLQMGGIQVKGGPYPRMRFNYWPYGQVRAGGDGQYKYGLAAMEFDFGSESTFDHARFYRGATGRFNAPDKLSGFPSDPDSWNRYAYARNNPLRLVDPDGLQAVDAKAVVAVPVNVIYSNADRPTLGFLSNGPSLRSVTEKGISYSRSFMAEAGIALMVRRFEGNISHPGGYSASGTVTVDGRPVDLSAFLSGHKGLNVIVSGDLVQRGFTQGTNTMIGLGSTSDVFNDEVNHALGNTNTVLPRAFGIANMDLDLRLDFQEGRFNLGGGIASAWQSMIRGGAVAAGGCSYDDPGCKARMEYERRVSQ